MSRTGDHVERVREQFTRQADAYAGMRQTRDEASLEALVRLVGAGAADRAVDLACGPGFLTMAFAKHCRSALGIDATEAFLRRAREEASARGLANVEFRPGVVDRLDLEDGGFDVASCRAAFHHFEDPPRVLAEMKRIVRPGGRLLVADMLGSGDASKAAYHDRIERLCDPTHVRALPEAELEALFADLGLEILHRPTSRMEYDLEEWIAHGGPDDETAREIRELFAASVETDLCGLDVRREDGKLRFSHAVAAFVLGVPAR